MAEEEKTGILSWLPVVVAIGVSSGLILSFQQLTSSRPGGGDPKLVGRTFDDQTVEARLWQDPLGVALEDSLRTRKSAEDKANYIDAHSSDTFQRLLIKKCLCLTEDPSQDPGGSSSTKGELDRLEFQEQSTRVIMIMIPGGPYVEAVERRLRCRRAVIEALGYGGYAPEKADELGYFSLPWLPLEPDPSSCVKELADSRNYDVRNPNLREITPIRQAVARKEEKRLIVPYEWCEPTTREENRSFKRILILWLDNEAFGDAPLARLADLISFLQVQVVGGSAPRAVLPPFKTIVIGPDDSGTLRRMVTEAVSDLWDAFTRDALAETSVISSQAAAADSQLLSGSSDGDSVSVLIEKKIHENESPCNHFSFKRIGIPDDGIADSLWKELFKWDFKDSDYVAILSEEDTFYARALSETFKAKAPVHFQKRQILSYTYLRGIDGKLPSDVSEEKPPNNPPDKDDKNANGSSHPKEQTEGNNQADDIRRLAMRLAAVDRELRTTSNSSLRAVGLLGSDVYDKLELLKALRPVLPDTIFFTNNLDARLIHPDEWNETHNLIVVAPYDLAPHTPTPATERSRVAPFRESQQTGLYAAILEAIDAPRMTTDQPRIFEVARDGFTPLDSPDGLNQVKQNAEKIFWPAVGLTVAGILFVFWAWFVSRVNPNRSK